MRFIDSRLWGQFTIFRVLRHASIHTVYIALIAAELCNGSKWSLPLDRIFPALSRHVRISCTHTFICSGKEEKKSPIKFLLAAFYVGLSAKTR